MTCPHSGNDRSDRYSSRSRREFFKAAVSIGGINALTASLERVERDGAPLPDAPDSYEVPGGESFDGPERRQHAWNDYLTRDNNGEALHPFHHLLLFYDYAGDGTPTDEDRAALEDALTYLEETFEWSNRGLLFTAAYSPDYFDRFEEDLHASVELPEPKSFSPTDDPEFDDFDMVLQLASDLPHKLLLAEQLLTDGQVPTDHSLPTPIDDVVTLRERRTGFQGEGLPAKHQDVEGIPDDEPISDEAPLYMGFASVVPMSQPSEDRITIEEGPFAGGTTQHVSRLDLELEGWYGDHTVEERARKMLDAGVFEHTPEGFATDNAENVPHADIVGQFEKSDIHTNAEKHGFVSHALKTITAREDGLPIIYRRDTDTADGGRAGTN